MTNFLQMQLQRSDVVLCRVPLPSTELTQFKLRPAVIISASRLNQILDDVMVIPCTTNTSLNLTTTHYLITGEEVTTAGIRVESVVRCESIFTLNKSMIIRRLGCLSNEGINAVNECLIVALELRR